MGCWRNATVHGFGVEKSEAEAQLLAKTALGERGLQGCRRWQIKTTLLNLVTCCLGKYHRKAVYKHSK